MQLAKKCKVYGKLILAKITHIELFYDSPKLTAGGRNPFCIGRAPVFVAFFTSQELV